jgi:hypothetical protein
VRRATTTSLWGVLSSALILSGCGGVASSSDIDDQAAFESSEAPSLDDFSLASAGDGSEVRSVCSIDDYLARSAELEAAAVVAFQVLEAELCAHGAPQRLLERTRAAARDEVLHARLMQRLAARFGGEVTPRSIRVGPIRDLEQVALENALEGCVAETWGCLLGMHQALHATHARLRSAYRRIAADEARHAQLSWDVADWAERQLPASAASRVAERRARAVSELSRGLASETLPGPLERQLGLPGADARQKLFAQLRARVWS